jgi:hypothetical protein
LAVIATCLTISNSHANLPKYGKWCGNSDIKLKAKAIDKIDEACKRNFKCKIKAKNGFENLNCDIALINYLESRGENQPKVLKLKRLVLKFYHILKISQKIGNNLWQIS